MNYWIFQGDPRRWGENVTDKDFLNYLKKMQNVPNTWNVVHKKHASELKRGDVVYFWKAGKNAGIYAVGSVVKEAYKKKDEFGDIKVDVMVNKDGFLGERYLSRALIEYEPEEDRSKKVLKQMAIITSKTGTNFKLSHKQAARVEKLMRNHSSGELISREKYRVAFEKILNRVVKGDYSESLILNEADFKCYLYSKLREEPLFGKPSKKWIDGGGYRINLLHSEYYRGKTKKSKKGRNNGRWDIAILYPDPYPESWLQRTHSIEDGDFHNRRPVMIGCELKLKGYRDKDSEWKDVLNDIRGDASVFDDNGPIYGYVVYAHVIESDRASGINKQKRRSDIVALFKEIKKNKSHLKLYYLEWDEDEIRRSMFLNSE